MLVGTRLIHTEMKLSDFKNKLTINKKKKIGKKIDQIHTFYSEVFSIFGYIFILMHRQIRLDILW